MACDGYNAKLKECAVGIESLIGLADINPNTQNPYSQSGIVECADYVTKKIKSLSTSEVVAVNSEVGKYVVLLSYIGARLEFFGKAKFDFHVYPRVDAIAQVLLLFMKRSTIDERALSELNKIIMILGEVDKSYANFKTSLAYIYLRLFVMLALYGNYCNASMIAELLINQMLYSVSPGTDGRKENNDN